MGLDPQVASRESGVAFLAVFHVMAAFAALRIVYGFDGVDIDPVAPVALRFIIAAKIIHRLVVSRTAPGMTVEAELLSVALIAVLICLTCNYPVASHPVRVMIRSNTFRLMALVALRRLHLGIILMILLLGHRLVHIKT